MKFFIAIAFTFATLDAAAYFPSDAALSLLMHRNRSGANSRLCLSIDNKIPSNSFVATAAAKNISISPSIGCKYNKENHSVIHQQSGQMACFVSVSNFKQTEAALATAKYSANCGFMSSSTGTAVFLRSSNRWVFKEMRAIIVE